MALRPAHELPRGREAKSDLEQDVKNRTRGAAQTQADALHAHTEKTNGDISESVGRRARWNKQIESTSRSSTTIAPHTISSTRKTAAKRADEDAAFRDRLRVRRARRSRVRRAHATSRTRKPTSSRKRRRAANTADRMDRSRKTASHECALRRHPKPKLRDDSDPTPPRTVLELRARPLPVGSTDDEARTQPSSPPGGARPSGEASIRLPTPHRRSDHCVRGLNAFVYIHVVLFATWMLVFEKRPWPTLTLIVSLEAIFLSTFVMIGQNRQAAFEQAKADHDYADVNKLLVENTELTRTIHVLTEDVHGILFHKANPSSTASDSRHDENQVPLPPKRLDL